MISGSGRLMDEDSKFMSRAIELARRGNFRVMPNPLVGCILVKDSKIIAEGWHDHIGGLHAEQMAIADAEKKGVSVHGATAYVTLEPCNHFGRTPPCTEALLWAGVKKVVIGALDPNPTVRGGGVQFLNEQGIVVETGVGKLDCEKQMQEFMHWCKKRRPFVTLKAATDKDGRIDGDLSRPAERFSSSDSLDLAHKLRAQSMAILIGVGTVIRDNPTLTVRRGVDITPRDNPVRVIIDPNNRIPNNSKVMTDGLAKTLLIQSSDFDKSDDLDNIERVEISETDISIIKILDMLGDMGIQSLLVEGGADTWMRFLSSGLVDVVHLCVSPDKLKGDQEIVINPKKLEEFGYQEYEKLLVSGDLVTKWKKFNPLDKKKQGN